MKTATASFEAYELYLKGRQLLYKRGLSVPDALGHFRQAVALDPEYAPAWSGLADGHTVLGQYGFVHPAKTMPEAKNAALRAVALNDTLSEAHGALGGALLLHDWDVDAAELALKRALELNPGHTQARGWYALFVCAWTRGRFEEAVVHSTYMMRQDPLSSGFAAAVHTLALAYAGRLEEAIAHGNAVVARDATSYLAHYSLSQAYIQSARFAHAIEAGLAALAVSGRHQWTVGALAFAYAKSGNLAQARALYDELVARAGGAHVQPSVLAVAAAAVGLKTETVALIERAVDERDPVLINTMRYYPTHEPVRDALRDAGKLDSVMTRLGLAR